MAEAQPQYPDSDFSDDSGSPLEIAFNDAANHIRKISGKLEADKLLELYGLFKQGTEGKCETPKPGWFDARGRKKWEAWRSVCGMSIDEAQEKYIALVHKYDPDWSKLKSAEGGPDTWVGVSTLRHTEEEELVHNDLSLLDAARENVSDRVTELLSRNPELAFETDDYGLTALHWAADRDAVGALRAALVGGCTVNATDDSGQTALHYSVSCGHIESTKALVHAGALLLEDDDGKTPLDLAESDEIREILEGAKENKS